MTCEFCTVYQGATKESADFHNWIVEHRPNIWAKSVNDYLIYKLLIQQKCPKCKIELKPFVPQLQKQVGKLVCPSCEYVGEKTDNVKG